MMLRRPLLAAFVIGFVILGFARPAAADPDSSILKGRVVEVGGRPVGGARVSVVGRPGTVVADARGVFVLEPAPQPPFVVAAARPDGVAYRPTVITAMSGGDLVKVVVEPMGETVTVLSGAPPDLEVPPATAATVLGKNELVQHRPPNVAQALESVPGTSISGVGPAALPALRGLPKGRTLLLLDEGRVTAERRAGPSATFLDPTTIDELEVVRGPGSVAYGSDAFGGILRARSRMPSADARFGASYSVAAATAIGERGASVEATAPAGRAGLLIGAHYRSFDDVETPEGVVPNSGAEISGLRLAYERPIGQGTLRVGWRTDIGQDIGKPDPASPDQRNYYPDERSHRLSLGYDHPGGGGWTRLSAALLWDSYQLVLNKDALGPSGDLRSRARSDTDARDWEARFEAERPVFGAHLVVGANAYGRYGLRALNESYTFDPDGRPALEDRIFAIEDARRTDLGVFAGLAGPVGPLRLSGGLRADITRSQNTGGGAGDVSIDHTAVSGFAAAELSLMTDLDLSLQVARGFRDARLSDRFFTGYTGRGFIHGNPKLEPETSRQLDLALRYGHGNVYAAVYGYLYRISDLIERFKQDGEYYFRNRNEAELRGVEVEMGVELSEHLAFQAGVWTENGEVRTTGGPVDDVPPTTGFVTLRGQPDQRWSWRVRVRAADAKERPGPSERSVAGYVTLDAGLGLRIDPRLELRLLLRNVVDRSYYPTWDEDAILAAGRSLGITVRGSF